MAVLQDGRPRIPRGAVRWRTPSTCCVPTTSSSASSWTVGSWGRTPPAFDLLAWNADAMRIPGKAHAEFLRKFYLEHALVGGTLESFGERVSLSDVKTDAYVVAAKDDDIVPWTVVLPHHAVGRRPRPVRADVVGAHRRHRQPAGAQGAALDERGAPRSGRGLAQRRRSGVHQLVGRLGRGGSASAPAPASPPEPWAATHTCPSTPRPAPTSSRSRSREPRAGI